MIVTSMNAELHHAHTDTQTHTQTQTHTHTRTHTHAHTRTHTQFLVQDQETCLLRLSSAGTPYMHTQTYSHMHAIA